MAKFMIALVLMAIVALAHASPVPEPLLAELATKAVGVAVSGMAKAITGVGAGLGAGLGANAGIGLNIGAGAKAGVGADAGLRRAGDAGIKAAEDTTPKSSGFGLFGKR